MRRTDSDWRNDTDRCHFNRCLNLKTKSHLSLLFRHLSQKHIPGCSHGLSRRRPHGMLHYEANLKKEKAKNRKKSWIISLISILGWPIVGLSGSLQTQGSVPMTTTHRSDKRFAWQRVDKIKVIKFCVIFRGREREQLNCLRWCSTTNRCTQVF